MISRATQSFWHAYEQLATPQKNAARRAFRLFLQDPRHNSLQFKKLHGHADYWSVRVSRDIRAVGKRATRRYRGMGLDRYPQRVR